MGEQMFRNKELMWNGNVNWGHQFIILLGITFEVRCSRSLFHFQLCRKDLAAVEDELNKTQQVALAAKVVNHILGSINKTVASSTRDKINSLSLALMRLFLEYCVQFWTRKSWPAGTHLAKGHQTCLGAGEHGIWGEAEGAGFFSAWRRKGLVGHQIAVFTCLVARFQDAQDAVLWVSELFTFADPALLCLITQWSLVGTETCHALGLRQNWRGKNNHYMSKLSV